MLYYHKKNKRKALRPSLYFFQGFILIAYKLQNGMYLGNNLSAQPPLAV